MALAQPGNNHSITSTTAAAAAASGDRRAEVVHFIRTVLGGEAALEVSALLLPPPLSTSARALGTQTQAQTQSHALRHSHGLGLGSGSGIGGVGSSVGGEDERLNYLHACAVKVRRDEIDDAALARAAAADLANLRARTRQLSDRLGAALGCTFVPQYDSDDDDDDDDARDLGASGVARPARSIEASAALSNAARLAAQFASVDLIEDVSRRGRTVTVEDCHLVSLRQLDRLRASRDELVRLQAVRQHLATVTEQVRASGAAVTITVQANGASHKHPDSDDDDDDDRNNRSGAGIPQDFVHRLRDETATLEAGLVKITALADAGQSHAIQAGSARQSAAVPRRDGGAATGEAPTYASLLAMQQSLDVKSAQAAELQRQCAILERAPQDVTSVQIGAQRLRDRLAKLQSRRRTLYHAARDRDPVAGGRTP